MSLAALRDPLVDAVPREVVDPRSMFLPGMIPNLPLTPPHGGPVAALLGDLDRPTRFLCLTPGIGPCVQCASALHACKYV